MTVAVAGSTRSSIPTNERIRTCSRPSMNVLVCVKRVPETGGRISLTADERTIDTKFLGFTVSPHEECATEEAVRIVEARAAARPC